MRPAVRLMFEHIVGAELPIDLTARNICGVPHCANPHHYVCARRSWRGRPSASPIPERLRRPPPPEALDLSGVPPATFRQGASAIRAFLKFEDDESALIAAMAQRALGEP
jgi:hypothetical protein